MHLIPKIPAFVDPGAVDLSGRPKAFSKAFLDFSFVGEGEGGLGSPEFCVSGALGVKETGEGGALGSGEGGEGAKEGEGGFELSLFAQSFDRGGIK